MAKKAVAPGYSPQKMLRGQFGLNLALGALGGGPLLAYLSVRAYWLGGVRLWFFIGLAMLICAAVCLVQSAGSKDTEGMKGVAITVPLVVAILGATGVILGVSPMRYH